MNIIESSKNLIEKIVIKNYKDKECIKNNSILVTGGAGFLGVHLLKLLVESNHFNEVYTIVRDKEKITKQAKYFELDTEWISQVKVIEGDLLDIEEKNYPEVEYIVHSAAQIHCIKTLNQLWKNNIEATQKICDIYRNNKVFLISSLSVFVSSNLKGCHIEKSLDISDNYLLYGGYAQSKFIAEKIIEKYNHNIIRLGLITGSSKKGIFPEDFFKQFLKINQDIGLYPKGYENSYVDITPVDICAEEIYKCIINEEKIKHIANKKSTSIKSFIEVLKLKEIEKEIWIEKIDKLNNLEKFLLKFAYFKSEMLVNNFNYYNLDLFQSTNHSYDIKDSFKIKGVELLKLYKNKLKQIEFKENL